MAADLAAGDLAATLDVLRRQHDRAAQLEATVQEQGDLVAAMARERDSALDEAAALRSERDDVVAMLRGIESGGWWRLRSRIHRWTSGVRPLASRRDES